MSYASAVDHLNSLGLELAPPPYDALTGDAPKRVQRKFDLAHMRTLAAALGDPQNSFPSVLIAGTNGKGSTAATLASILAVAGYRTALYTSPHLVRVNERIQMTIALEPTEYASTDVPASAGPGALHPIDDEAFARLYFQVDEAAQRLVGEGALPHAPSYFEMLTALAFCYFAEQKVDIAILEVGLGGRLDATNIVEPLLSIITDIALDHMDYLGNTIAEITREKAGILRQNGILITLPQHPEANQAIGEAAATLNLRAISAAEYTPPVTPAFMAAANGSAMLPENRYAITVEGEQLTVDSPLHGQHQQRNIALAIAAAVALRNLSGSNLPHSGNSIGYNIGNATIEAGIRATNWPGRLELFAEMTPQLLLDVAHNPAGAWTLRSAIAQMPEDRPRTLIFSCLRDKNLTEMARILLPLFDSSPDGSPSRPFDHVIFAPIDSPRAASVEDLLAAAHALGIPAHAAPHVAGALAQARRVTPPGGLILATGSVYLIGELRQLALAQ
ncbi:MAG: FolC bifunctional protein [Acidobacteriaceae bacterium]|nr:FolC bifunctional protein [Acidobacteriaceae bacterium]